MSPGHGFHLMPHTLLHGCSLHCTSARCNACSEISPLVLWAKLCIGKLCVVTKKWQLQPSTQAAVICVDRQTDSQHLPAWTANTRAQGSASRIEHMLHHQSMVGRQIKQTDRQTDRQTERPTDRQTNDRHRHTDRHTDSRQQAGRQKTMDRHMICNAGSERWCAGCSCEGAGCLSYRGHPTSCPQKGVPLFGHVDHAQNARQSNMH